MSRRFRQWVDAYQDQAWTLARYLLKDPAEAEDAVQEAYVRVWDARGSIRREVSVRAYLLRAVANTAREIARTDGADMTWRTYRHRWRTIYRGRMSTGEWMARRSPRRTTRSLPTIRVEGSHRSSLTPCCPSMEAFEGRFPTDLSPDYS